MIGGLTIRLMTAEDLPGVDGVQRASFIPELWEDTDLFRAILSNAPESCFVAEGEVGQIMGYCLSYLTEPDRDDFEAGYRAPQRTKDLALYIHDLCIHPDARGQKLAQSLFSQTEIAAQKAAVNMLAGIAVQNSWPFWEKMGFEKQRYFPYHGEDGVLMLKKIDKEG